MGFFDCFMRKKEIGDQSYYSDAFIKDPMDSTERIVIRHASDPDHAGECRFGYSLVLNNGKWFFETTRRRAAGPVEVTYRYHRLKAHFWKGNIYETLNGYLRWDEPITPENVAEKEKLEQIKSNLSRKKSL